MSGYKKKRHIESCIVQTHSRPLQFDFEIDEGRRFSGNKVIPAFFKFRPFFDIINDAYKIGDLSEYLSVYESVVLCYIHYDLKKFIKENKRDLESSYRLLLLRVEFCFKSNPVVNPQQNCLILA